MRAIIFVLLVLLTFSCKNEEAFNANKVIESIKAMSKLGTTEYTISKIIAEEDNPWYAIGDRRVLISCKAYVTYGIDASLIQFTEVNPKEKKVKLTIPEVEMITFNIPPDELKITDIEVGMFRGKYSSKEINEFQQAGEKMILNQLKELKVETETEKNAILFLENVLRSAGFTSIEIHTSRELKK